MKPWACLLILCCFLATANYGWTQGETPQTVQGLEGFHRLGTGPKGELSLVNDEGKSIPLPPKVVVFDFSGEKMTRDFPLGALVEVMFFPTEEMRTTNHEENPFAIQAIKLIVE